MAKLGEVCDILNGYAFKSNQYTTSGVRIIRISNVQKGYIEDKSPVYYPCDDENVKKYELKQNDLLISLTGNVGRTALLEEKFLPAALNQRVSCVRLKEPDKVLKTYLFHLLNSDYFEQQCMKAAEGVAQKNLSPKWLFEYKIPIYSIERQKEISNTLDKIDLLIILRKQQLAKLDELVKARFVEMFGDEQTFNKEPLSQNVEEMFIGPFGSSLKNESFVSKENGYCMVYEQKHAIRKTMDVETRYIDKPKYEELKRFSIHGGDIIVSCRGTIGETYIVPLNAPLGIMHPSIMKIRVKDSIYNRVFFDFLLQEKLKQHEAQANGSGVKMAVTASALGKEEFIVPSIPFQNQFAAFVERVDQQKQTVQQSLKKLELMKKALMQEYFG